MIVTLAAHTRLMNATRNALITALWNHVGGSPDLLSTVEIDGPDVVLPSVFDVTGFAAAAVGVANLAVAELAAARSGRPVPGVRVDRRHAAAAFVCERLLSGVGWELAPVWDPIAGDYETADGWIRLHTNYSYHRDAVTSLLGVTADRDVVAAAVKRWAGDDLEHAVVDAGGCAAVMRTAEQWRSHPAGIAASTESPVTVTVTHLPHPVLSCESTTRVVLSQDRTGVVGARPLDGVRVLDLTRVIAGPVATRFLAAHGADVLRIDPPGFAEVELLLPETTRGKRCAALDLRDRVDRATFEHLVSQADVVVAGLRPGAMTGLGYGPEALRELNGSVITVNHSAYGWSGPWADRRGFDSLVQMSAGIAAAGIPPGVAGSRPAPLPAQALDHGTGFLLAAATCRALSERLVHGRTCDVRGSLLGAANVLMAHPTPGAISTPPPTWTDADTESVTTHWGSVHQARIPGIIDGCPAAFDPNLDAGPLGRHRAEFATLSASRAS